MWQQLTADALWYLGTLARGWMQALGPGAWAFAGRLCKLRAFRHLGT